MELYIVPVLLFISSILMAFAWLGHIRYRQKSFLIALLVSWILVLPEYVLNITAFRWGHGVYEGGEMAAINLCSGVVCVALVSRTFLNEMLHIRQILGFVLMTISVALILWP